MLVIRKEQMEAMAVSTAASFEEELVDHVKRFAPKHAETIGDDAVRKVVRQGLERAKAYGLTNRGPIRFFVELMLMYGSDFDTDPLLPWAQGVLENPSIKDQMEKADILHEAMEEYSKVVPGPEKKNLFDALRRINKGRLDDFQSESTGFDSGILAALKNIYPQKCQYVGDEMMRDLIRRGKDEAIARSISKSNGAAMLIALMFQLGHGVLNDPLFPWISSTIDDESVTDPNERAENLRGKIKAFLNQTLKNLGQENADG